MRETAPIDTEPRGLLVPAWRGGRALAIVAAGRYIGKTVPEVAEIVGCSIDHARQQLLDASSRGRMSG